MATYYISFSSGSDSNDGLSKTTSWQRHPYMQKFGGKYIHAAGDVFIFKMGDTWPNDCFDMVIQHGGAVGNSDFYTFDATWGTLPTVSGLAGLVGFYKFDAQNKPINGTDKFNRFIYNNTNDNIIFNGIEFTGMTWTGTGGSFGNVECIDIQRSQNVIVSNCWFHGWTHPGATQDNLKCVVGNGNAPWNAGSRVTGCVFDGQDSGGPGVSDSGAATFAIPLTDFNIVRNMTNGLLTNANAVIHDNYIHHINLSFDPGVHENAIEPIDMIPGGTSTNYFYNNVWHDCTAVGILTQGAAPSTGIEIDYLWNNVAFVGSRNAPIPFQFDSISLNNSKCEVHCWNNTVVGGPGVCMRTISRGNGNFGVLDLQNNHCISDQGMITLGVSGNKFINVANLVQKLAQAEAEGYVSTEQFAYSPIARGSTIGAGVNLSAAATGVFASLIADTTYGAQRSPVARLASGPWDIGAYEFVPTGQPNPPSNLTAIGK